MAAAVLPLLIGGSLGGLVAWARRTGARSTTSPVNPVSPAIDEGDNPVGGALAGGSNYPGQLVIEGAGPVYQDTTHVTGYFEDRPDAPLASTGSAYFEGGW